jgi:hypothetical protein
MSSDQLIQRLLEQVEGSHISFIRFVGRIARHEWDWSPDQGIQSAHDVALNLLREEHRLVAKVSGRSGGVPAKADPKALATPSAAASTLRTSREATIAALQQFLPIADETIAQRLVQSAVSLAQLDAHALGELVMIQRLIDPSRATVSPR